MDEPAPFLCSRYSLAIGKGHVNLVNEKLQKLIYSGQLDQKELDRLAVISMVGLAAEGLEYNKVVGQSSDLSTLQVMYFRNWSHRMICCANTCITAALYSTECLRMLLLFRVSIF